MREDDVILGVLPLAFDYGLYQMIMAFRRARAWCSSARSPSRRRCCKVMVEEGVTGFPGVPTMFAMLGGDEDAAAITTSRSIRYVTNTAAALPVKHITDAAGALPAARGSTRCTA